MANAALVAGAAARGASWLKNSALGKRVASAAVGSVAGRYRRVVRRKFALSKEAENGAGASAQYSKTVSKFGKYRSKMFNFSKLIRKNMASDLCRFGGARRFTDSAGGYFQLYLRDNVAAGLAHLPIHVLDLTGLPDYTSTISKPLKNLYPFLMPTLTKTSGLISWGALTGADNSGTGSYAYWQRLMANKNASTGNAVLEWTSAKFLFRCPKTRPGWFKVHLVQFNDEEILPTWPANNTDINTKTHGFWQKRAKALMFNPISHEANPIQRKEGDQGMKIIKTWTRRWNPDTSDNLATYNGEQIRLDLFIRHNRYVNRLAGTGGAHTVLGNDTTAGLDNDAFVSDNNTVNTNQVESYVYNTAANPKARLFFVIEGTNFDAAQDAFDPQIHLSYDMEVRNKWIFQDTNID